MCVHVGVVFLFALTLFLRCPPAKKKKRSPVSGHWVASKAVRWHAFFWCFFQPSFFFASREIRDSLYTRFIVYAAQTKFPMYKVWWLRVASQIGQTFIPQCEKVAAIGHRFIAKKKKIKIADVWV